MNNICPNNGIPSGNNHNISFGRLFPQKAPAYNADLLDFNIPLELTHPDVKVAIRPDSVIRFRNKYNIDLTEKQMQKKLKHLKEGESLVFGRKDFNSEDTTISRRQFQLEKSNGVLFISNLSQYGTKFVLKNPKSSTSGVNYQQSNIVPLKKSTKNFDPFYLKTTFQGNPPNFAYIFKQKYDEIRLANYSDASTFTSSVQELADTIKTNPKEGMCIYQSPWSIRTFKGAASLGHLTNRVSLNVKADANLIKELDELMISGTYTDSKGRKCAVPPKKQVQGIYKTYSEENLDKWTSRHDPITMYFSGDMTPEMLDGISEISKKYARPSSNGVELFGALPSKPWIAYGKEPKEEDLLNLVSKVKGKYPELAEGIMKKGYQRWNYKSGYHDFLLSAGEFEAIKIVAEEYDAFKRLR